MNIQPTADRILVKMLPDVRSSVIYTAPDENSRLLKGEILALGPKVDGVSVGECVLFTQACKEPLPKHYGDDLMLIRDGDLAGVIDPAARVTDGRNAEM